MDAPSSGWWMLAFVAATLAYLFVASARIAFRLLGPVTIEALVDRIGPERTEFLRKSLRAPTAFWFSLSLANSAALLAVTVIFLASLGQSVEAFLASAGLGPAASTLVLYGGLLLAVTCIEMVLPVAISRLDRTWFVERTLPVIRGLHRLLLPLSRVVATWCDAGDEDDDEEAAGDEEVEAFITVGQREGIIEEAGGDLLRNIVLFSETRVREVMTPRTDVVGLEATATITEMIDVFAATRHSRLPVHEGGIDDVVGIVSLKDAVTAMQEGRGAEAVTAIATPPLIVPESKRVSELLREMQGHRQHLALVVDEYGGTAGLVTIEDLIEEIVGEIREEHEEGEDLHGDEKGGWIVRGRAPLHDIAQAIGLELPEPESGTATIGGLLLSTCDRVPAPGEVIQIGHHSFAVEEADRRRILRVRITRTIPRTGTAAGLEARGA